MINNSFYKNKWSGSDLDRVVSIKTVSSVAVDGDTNYETITWSANKEIKAHVKEMPISKEEDIAGGQIFNSVLTIVIRYKSEYDTTQLRVTYKGKIYDVVDVREGLERRRWLILECRYGKRGFNTGV